MIYSVFFYLLFLQNFKYFLSSKQMIVTKICFPSGIIYSHHDFIFRFGKNYVFCDLILLQNKFISLKEYRNIIKASARKCCKSVTHNLLAFHFMLTVKIAHCMLMTRGKSNLSGAYSVRMLNALTNQNQ